MKLYEAIELAKSQGNTSLVEELQKLNPTNNEVLAQCEIKMNATLEKFEGEKQESSLPVETIVIS